MLKSIFKSTHLACFILILLFSNLAYSSSHHAGATLGNLSVDAAGTANYSLGIEVPPGTSGMQPEIALRYSTGASNGHLGAGWSLEATSAIVRCNAKLATDGYNQGAVFNSRDRFCLNGQRLIAINGTYGADGTEYRTQGSSDTKIVSYGQAGSGPAYFKVWSKSGQVSTYGLDNRTYCGSQGITGDSRIEAQGKSSVLLWSIGKIEDAAGNYMNFCYHENNSTGEYRVARIDYTANDLANLSPFAHIEFSYEARNDTQVHYVKGSMIVTEYRINEINTYVNSQHVKKYKIGYRYSTSEAKSSLLNRVEECSTDGICKLPTAFQWKDASKPLTFQKFSTWNTMNGSTDKSCRAADYNRDGLEDIICHSKTFVSTGTAFNTVSYNVSTYGYLENVLDYNGDDYPDLLFTELDPDGQYISYGSASGFQSYVKVRGSNPWGLIGDINGDGKETLQEGGPNSYMADVDGDGLDDYIDADLSIGVNVSTSGVTYLNYPFRWSGNSISSTSHGNINGDNYPEIIGSGGGITTSTGNRFETFNYTVEGGKIYIDYESESKALLADVNGDGLSDLIILGGQNSTSVQVAIANQNPPELMTTITNGLGEQLRIEYSDTSDPTVYTQNLTQSQLSYPLSPLRNHLPVVKRYFRSDGLGGEYSLSYYYEDGLVHRNTYGFLGFKRMTYVDDRSQIKNVTLYSQDYQNHTHGRAIESSTLTSTGQLLEHSQSQWETIVLPASSFDAFQRVEVRTKSTAESSYELDTALLISTITNSYQYDAYSNVIKLTTSSNDGYTSVTTSQYDNNELKWQLGRLRHVTVTKSTPYGDTGTRTSAFEYYANGMLHKEIVEPGNLTLEKITTYAYDGYGNKTSSTVSGRNFTARTTSIAYDSKGQFPIRTTNALGHYDQITYDPKWGVKTSLIGPNNLETQWVYDTLGRKTKEIRADGTVSTITYSICDLGASCQWGAPLWVTTQTTGSAPSTVYFDMLGREIRTHAANFDGSKTIVKLTEYDVHGRAKRVSQKHFQGFTHGWTTNEYDLLGRVKKAISPDASFTTITYNGLSTSTTNHKGQTSTEIKNTQGKIIQVNDAMSGISTFEHDAFGNLVSTVDNVGNVTSMSYDIVGNKIAMDDLDMGHWEYRYNGLGELTWQKDAKNQETTLTYDTLGRMIQRQEREGISTWTYDTATKGIGKLARSVSASGVTTDHVYDNLGRASSSTKTIDSKTFTTALSYDFAGRVLTTTYPSSYVIKNIYNAQGSLTKVQEVGTNKVFWTLQDTDANGKPVNELLGNGVQTLRAYDPSSELLTGIITGQSGAIQSLAYNWDVLGNLDMRRDDNQGITETFGYDNLNRLITSTIGSQVNRTEYDTIGNITFKTGVGIYEYNCAGSPHAVSKAGDTYYGFDKNGNMIGGDGRTMTYTSFNKPLNITRGSTTNQYVYDIDRNRIKKVSTITDKTTTTYYVGKSFEQVIDASTNIIQDKHYINTGNTTIIVTKRSNNTQSTYYQHLDHLGSPDVITDASGNVINGSRTSFDAWGARRQVSWADTGNFGSNLGPVLANGFKVTTLGFTGHEQEDEIGLVNMNARMYDAKLGRFLSPDTFVQFPYSTQGMNRYTYVNNNPLSFTDPSGHFLKGLLKGLRKFFSKYGRMIMSIAMAYITAGLASGYALFGSVALNQGVMAGFVSGFASTGSLKGGLQGALSGALFAGIGDQFAKLGELSNAQFAGKIAAHGIAGGISSKISGGAFKDGFISAAFTQSLSRTKLFKAGQTLKNTAKAAIVGGIGSKLGGGKFSNGAVTGAFSRLFNEEGEGHGDDVKLSSEESKSGFEIDKVGARTVFKRFGMPDIPDANDINMDGIRLADDMLVTAYTADELIKLLEPNPFQKFKAIPILRRVFGNYGKQEYRNQWHRNIDNLKIGAGAMTGVKANTDIKMRYYDLYRQ